MFVLLRTSSISLDEVEKLRNALASRGLEVYVSAYPLENDIGSTMALGGAPLAPYSVLTRILSVARRASEIPSEVKVLLATSLPGLRSTAMVCSEVEKGCVIACPLGVVCDWENLAGFLVRGVRAHALS